MKKLISCLILFVVLTVITGVVYPAVVTGIAYIFFPQKAAGSLVKKHGNTIGSSLIGQKFSSPSYFWGRPSASDYGTDALRREQPEPDQRCAQTGYR